MYADYRDWLYYKIPCCYFSRTNFDKLHYVNLFRHVIYNIRKWSHKTTAGISTGLKFQALQSAWHLQFSCATQRRLRAPRRYADRRISDNRIMEEQRERERKREKETAIAADRLICRPIASSLLLVRNETEASRFFRGSFHFVLRLRRDLFDKNCSWLLPYP